MRHWIERSGIAHWPIPTPHSGPQVGVGPAQQGASWLVRGSGSRQDDQARIVGTSMNKTGLFSVADRLVERQTRKTDIATDALGSPPGMRGLGTKAVELGDERRRALKTVLVAHQLLVPQRHGACHQAGTLCSRAGG